ncbi:UDP-phosphate galactose phosphotransferase, partial [Klebsiella pneumoniae]
MSPFGRNIIVSSALALSDIITFAITPFIAIFILSLAFYDFDKIAPVEQYRGWVVLHCLLAFCCVSWFSIR